MMRSTPVATWAFSCSTHCAGDPCIASSIVDSLHAATSHSVDSHWRMSATACAPGFVWRWSYRTKGWRRGVIGADTGSKLRALLRVAAAAAIPSLQMTTAAAMCLEYTAGFLGGRSRSPVWIFVQRYLAAAAP